MKRSVITSAALIVVAALTLSACSSPVAGVMAGLGKTLRVDAPAERTVQAQLAAAPAAPAAAVAAQNVDINDLQATLERLYETANQSVVNIRTMTDGSAVTVSPEMPDLPNMPGFPFDPNQLPDMPRFGVGQGSGWVWDATGHIVTNNHVVNGAKEISVTFSDGTTLDAELVGTDPDSDLAVVKVDPTKVKLLPLPIADSTQARPGQLVVAIGNPFGLEGSMSFGIVSALGRTLAPENGSATMSSGSYRIPDIIQTDAPVNPGNSGGALLDLQGRLLGVPTAIESPVRASAGVGFAVPAVIVQKVVPELIENGKFVHPYVGISGGTLSSELAKAMELDEAQRGVLVNEVTEDGPADKAGLQGSSREVEILGQKVEVGGDVITAIEGQQLKDFEDLVTWLARFGKVGQEVTLSVLRTGDNLQVKLTLGARPGQDERPTAEAQPQQPQERPAQPAPTQPAPERPAPSAPVAGGAWLGVGGVALTPEIAGEMDLGDDAYGVLIQAVAEGSPAAGVGLKAGEKEFDLNGETILLGGDVISEVNGRDIDSLETLINAIRSRKPGEKVELTLLRDGGRERVEVTLGERPAGN
jgi:2-alkenal reductase